MFFSEKITSIRPNDRVLEIGPGATPHRRSNTFLEMSFHTIQDKLAQRGGGGQEANFGSRPVYFYDGGTFPFEDNEFDYVICSHVVEHVADPIRFIDEIFRVSGGRGYLEYPLITYEYMYNFDVHLHFVKFDFDQMMLRYLPKLETSFNTFSGVNSLLYKTLVLGWDDLCSSNKNLFFEGFEFNEPFLVEKTNDLSLLLPASTTISPKKALNKFFGQVVRKLGL